MILPFVPPALRPPPAGSLLAQARKAAGASGRNVLVRFTAPWCGPCHEFAKLLGRPQATRVVAANYVVVDLTISPEPVANPEANDLFNAWGRGRVGIPFYVVLTPDYHRLADSRVWTSDGRENAGGDPTRFLQILRRTAPHATAADLNAVRDEIGATDAPET